jgi:SpoVK/Ycf46/Vps4 family AAA+-type ATPase
VVGPSGCGKTSLVRSVVANCEAALVVVQGPEVYRPQPGDTEGWLRIVFEEAADFAQEGRCVLLEPLVTFEVTAACRYIL